jgi:hypothetical protein
MKEQTQLKKPQKIFKHMETEQHSTKKTMADWKNKGRIQKIARIQ